MQRRVAREGLRGRVRDLGTPGTARPLRWRNPIRDYRPRMKEVLKLQGLIAHATVRPPQLGVDDAERAELKRLAAFAGLFGGRKVDIAA